MRTIKKDSEIFEIGQTVTINPDLDHLKKTKWFNPQSMSKFAGITSVVVGYHAEVANFYYLADTGTFGWSVTALQPRESDATKTITMHRWQLILHSFDSMMSTAFKGIPNTFDCKDVYEVMLQLRTVLAEKAGDKDASKV